MQETRPHLEALRDAMRRVNVAAVIIPGTDPHHSEYVNDHWKLRDWLTGFTGSNGTAVVTAHDALLWTDSRYFLQAEQQLEDSGFVLMRENGDEADLTREEWLAQNLGEDDVIAIDGRLFTVMEASRLERFCGENGFMLATEFDVAERVWDDRPPLPNGPAYVHDEALAGERASDKIDRVLESVENLGADAMFISALDDIAWLLNLRGSDVEFTPVVTAFAYISAKDRSLFIDRSKVTNEVERHLKQCDVRVRDYDDVTRYLERRSEHDTVLLDPNTVSDTLANAMPCQKVYAASPITALKAIKNEVQIQGFRRAMEHDGAAMVRLLKWVEETAPGGSITELDVWERGKQERARSNDYRGDSFAMIAGYKEHGAIVHYEADEQSASTLHGEGLLLIDSGGQYLTGTTDLTRTITLGNPTPDEMHDYTLVLKGHLALARAQWPDGLCGVNLDVLARLPLWQEGMTYWHGTGHGVGHFLGCHEGPHSIRTEQNPVTLHAGMVVSDEPGLYKAGRYGIRTENLLLVVEGTQSDEFGRFLRFETLTLCPYDLRLIDRSMLTPEEVAQINAYHREVRDRLASLLDADEAQWLAERTREL
ncbi:MAG: aminopeptidase P family protein [Muribaculaceae bacterium]|nr:aminopeptidase P family protein [Muribaculaceae bacterium]